MASRILALAALLALLVPATALAAPGGITNPSTLQSLAEARQASARYHDPAAAIADGYIPTTDCVEVPGLGGMGQHWIHPGRFADPALDVSAPEVLLYVPSGQGLRLVAVEYVAIDSDQDLSTTDNHSGLFGVPFDGPMPGHFAGMPIHSELHVWVWQANPAGVFAGFNPSVHCD